MPGEIDRSADLLPIGIDGKNAGIQSGQRLAGPLPDKLNRLVSGQVE